MFDAYILNSLFLLEKEKKILQSHESFSIWKVEGKKRVKFNFSKRICIWNVGCLTFLGKYTQESAVTEACENAMF